MIITEEIKKFFGQFGPLFYILEDYRSSPEVVEKKKAEIIALLKDADKPPKNCRAGINSLGFSLP